MYSKNTDKYYIDLKKDGFGLIEVTKEVHDIYYQMERRERYLIERDSAHGLLHYDAWSHERLNGEDYIVDRSMSLEQKIVKSMMPSIWDYVDMVGDEYNICRYIALEKTEEEIATIFGITQSGINKSKKKVFQKLREILMNERYCI